MENKKILVLAEGSGNIKFSIILATLDRSNCIQNSVDSILNQTYQDYEVIIVDQSNDDETKRIFDEFYGESNKVLYYKVNFKGLSAARNYGIKKCTGNYVCLMDDDAEYRDTFLENAKSVIDESECSVVSGLVIDKLTNNHFVKHMRNIDKCQINYKNIGLCVSASLVIDRKKLKDIGGFDEQLGVGAKFGSGEETDVILSLLNRHLKVVYSNKLVVYHPCPTQIFDEKIINRAYHYGLGEGAIYKKHSIINKRKYIFIFKLYKSMFKSLIAILIYIFNANKRKFYINRLISIIRGFSEYSTR